MQSEKDFEKKYFEQREKMLNMLEADLTELYQRLKKEADNACSVMELLHLSGEIRRVVELLMSF